MEKKTTNKFYQFDNDIYPISLFVNIGGTEEYLNKVFYSYDGDILTSDLAYGITYSELIKRSDKKSGILVWFPSKQDATAKIIAHESFHVMAEMMRSMKIAFDKIDCGNEHLAYLIEWIVDCITKAVNNKTKPLTK